MSQLATKAISEGENTIPLGVIRRAVELRYILGSLLMQEKCKKEVNIKYPHTIRLNEDERNAC